MDASPARDEFLRAPAEARLARIADGFEAVAAAAQARAPAAHLQDAVRQTQDLCAWAAPEASADDRTLLTNLQTALATWHVWPRLGRQPEFQHAVAREAGRWAKHLRGRARPAR
jgi:hypothetical protein